MKLKVCGMRETENILDLSILKPDYMGFIFWEKSSRFVKKSTPDLNKKIKKTRSEERRVGKECRSRWSPYH